jgi:type II secretory pathway pseudopilin PulG
MSKRFLSSPILLSLTQSQTYIQPHSQPQREAGLTLIETMVSLLVFLAVMAGVVPAYMTYRLQALKNPVRTGAVAVSQQVMEEIRQIGAVNTLPPSGSFDKTPAPKENLLSNLSAYGKTYSAMIYYCEKPTFCDANSRYIRVAVFQKFGDGSLSSAPVYEVSTVFTRFEAR